MRTRKVWTVRFWAVKFVGAYALHMLFSSPNIATAWAKRQKWPFKFKWCVEQVEITIRPVRRRGSRRRGR